MKDVLIWLAVWVPVIVLATVGYRWMKPRNRRRPGVLPAPSKDVLRGQDAGWWT